MENEGHMKYEKTNEIPTRLHHGTSLSRWKTIQTEGLLVNQKKLYREKEKDSRIFLTADEENAIYYALKTVEMEKQLTELELKECGIKKRKKDALVLEIDTTRLNQKNIFLDSEDIEKKGWYVHFGNIPRDAIITRSVTNINLAGPAMKLRIEIDMKINEGQVKEDPRIIADALELMINKTNKLVSEGRMELMYDSVQTVLQAMLVKLMEYDQISTKGKFFPHILKEVIHRGLPVTNVKELEYSK
jgi:hypothetical protein